MKFSYFLMALLSCFLFIGCGQNVVPDNVPNALNQANSPTDPALQDENDTPFNALTPLDYIVLDLPSEAIGMFTSEDQQIAALVESPNETNIQSLDLSLDLNDIRTIDLTNALSYWKIYIYNQNDAPTSIRIEDMNVGEGKYGVVQNIPPNQVTTIYNTIPWPAGQYEVQVMTNEQISAAILTTEKLNGVLIEQ